MPEQDDIPEPDSLNWEECFELRQRPGHAVVMVSLAIFLLFQGSIFMMEAVTPPEHGGIVLGKAGPRFQFGFLLLVLALICSWDARAKLGKSVLVLNKGGLQYHGNRNFFQSDSFHIPWSRLEQAHLRTPTLGNAGQVQLIIKGRGKKWVFRNNELDDRELAALFKRLAFIKEDFSQFCLKNDCGWFEEPWDEVEIFELARNLGVASITIFFGFWSLVLGLGLLWLTIKDGVPEGTLGFLLLGFLFVLLGLFLLWFFALTVRESKMVFNRNGIHYFGNRDIFATTNVEIVWDKVNRIRSCRRNEGKVRFEELVIEGKEQKIAINSRQIAQQKLISMLKILAEMKTKYPHIVIKDDCDWLPEMSRRASRK